MKVLLTTIVDNINFGTYLQAFATAHLLKRFGADVEILNYIRPYLTGKYYAKKIFDDKRNGLIKRLIKSTGYYLLNAFMIWNLKRFLSSNVKLTDKISNQDQLINKFNGKYDLYLTGSDQVWNTQHNMGVDPIFFFDGIDGIKKAYAASVGLESFNSSDKEKIYSYLKKFSQISVRESFGIKALEGIGINNAVQVLDPTLLINKEEWLQLCKKKFTKAEKYLLIYSVEIEKNNEVYKIASQIAKERDLKIYLVCPTLKFKSSLPDIDKLFTLANVDLFISLISQADYIVCSSFHGTAFAINFNKQFVTVAPERFNTRVKSLLNLLSIEKCYISSINDFSNQDIDFENVNKKLNYERTMSLNYMKGLIMTSRNNGL